MTNSTLLITGASGFLGRAALASLSDQQAARTVAVSRSGTSLDDRCQWAAADLLDQNSVAELFAVERPTRLLHLAWLAAESADRYEDPANSRWVGATRSIIDAFIANGGTRVVVAGSCIEYGPTNGIISEAYEPAPDTLYGQTKLQATNDALALGEAADACTAAVGRVFFAFGPHEDTRRLIPSVALNLLEGREASLSAGTQRRDFLPARKIAEALLALLDTDEQGVFNIGSGESISVRDLAMRVGNVIGRTDLLRFGARPAGGDHAEELTADISRIIAATNWRPDFDLSTEIKTLVAALMEAHPHLETD